MFNITQYAEAVRPYIAEISDITNRSSISGNMTDEDARKQLPQISLVLDEYHRHRVDGDDPPTALTKTLALWRELRGGAYVPHRGT